MRASGILLTRPEWLGAVQRGPARPELGPRAGASRVDQLLANLANWRIHPKTQQDALAGALDQVGWVQQVLVNRSTGLVVDGHARVALALSRDGPTVPVLYVDLEPAEEALVLARRGPGAAG